MKKSPIIIALASISLCFSLSSCNQEPRQAVAYNDDIVDLQDEVVHAIEGLDRTFEEYIPQKMDSAHDVLLAILNQNLQSLEEMESFNADTTLHKAAVELFQAYESIAKEDYPELIRILKIPDSTYTSDDQKKSFEVKARLERKRELAHERFVEAQKLFGNAHDFSFQEESTSR